MTHFVKLFDSIIHSTIWQEEAHVKVVWVTMLALADSKGEVQASIPGLAKASGVSLEQCLESLALFMSPDPYSRSKDDDGRRIQEIRGGWELINYKHYRDLKSSEQEKENAAERQKRKRERDAQSSRSVTDSHALSRDVTNSHCIVEEELEVEVELLKTTPLPPKGDLKVRRPKVKLEGDPAVMESFLKGFEMWPSEQPDGNAAPYSPKAACFALFSKICQREKIPHHTLAVCMAIYCRDQDKAKRYVVSAKTFLGPQNMWLDFIPRANAWVERKALEGCNA